MAVPVPITTLTKSQASINAANLLAGMPGWKAAPPQKVQWLELNRNDIERLFKHVQSGE